MDMIRTVSHSVKEEDEDLRLHHHGPAAPRSPRTKPTSLLRAVEEVTAPRTLSSRDDNAVIPAVVDGPHQHQLHHHHHRLLSSSSSFLATEDETAQATAATSGQENMEADRHVVQSGPAEIPCEFGAEDGVVVGSASCVDEEEDDNEQEQHQQQRADNHNNVEADEEEDDEEDYEYEDEDETPFTGFLVDHPQIAASRSDDTDNAAAAATSNNHASSSQSHPTKIEDEEAAAAAAAAASKPKWREPTRAAVNMSLRAEQETSGSKRRLAQDLYRIMNQDTQEAGFSLQPASEDSMDKWTITLFQFDEDSNLAKDMKVLGLDAIELEMVFPDQYPFEPPFVRVVRPRFKKQTGFVMNGALCMELLTKDGWNPINDIESVIVSVRSLLVVGDGRLEAAANLSETKYAALLAAANETKIKATADGSAHKRQRKNSAGESVLYQQPPDEQGTLEDDDHDTNHSGARPAPKQGGSYSVSEAKAAYTHLSDYHKKKGWDTTGWWARKG